jgi:hypothetical protein
MSSPPGKIEVAQVSFGASWNASLPSTRLRKHLANRAENRDFYFFVRLKKLTAFVELESADDRPSESA